MSEELAGYIQIIVYGTAIITLIIALAVTLLLRHQKKHRLLVEQRNQFTRTILESRLEIREETLKLVSQEIHDNIGQVLSLVKLNLYTLDAGEGDGGNQQLRISRDLVSKAISDLRLLSHTLDGEHVVDIGLTEATRAELDRIRQSGVLHTGMEVLGDPFRLDKQKELIVFRMVQEVIQNCLKHAGASVLRVTVSYSMPEMTLAIEDNGKGMHPLAFENHSAEAGIGVQNLKKRAELIGGQCCWQTEPGAGTTVIIKV